MPISMLVRKEMPDRGERLAEGSVAWSPPPGLLNLRDTPQLVAVDPYGDTVFNHFQCREQLPREIAHLREHLHHDAEVAMLDELDRLVGITLERVHGYWWFVGD